MNHILRGMTISALIIICAGCISLDDIVNNSGNGSGTTRSISRNTPGGSGTTIGSNPSSRLSGDLSLPERYDTAYSYRTKEPYQNMRDLPAAVDALRGSNPDEYIRHVVRIIGESARNDFEKVKMAHDLVALLIRYDAVSYLAGTYPDQSYRRVLKTRLAVCAGYANTFQAFCDRLDIPCEVVHGYARGVGASPLSESVMIGPNHAWNIVTIEGKRYLIDCTWDSGYLDGKVFKQAYTTDWLFLKPEHFIHYHYPENSGCQLLSVPLTVSQFNALPFLRPGFFDIALDMSINLKKVHRVDNSLSFSYTPKEGYYLSFTVNDSKTGLQLKNRIFIQSEGTRKTAFFSFPSKGQYSVKVFLWKTGVLQGEEGGEFIVEAQSANAVQYPTIYPSLEPNASILTPIEKSLVRGGRYTFTINAGNEKSAVIICNRTFIQLVKQDNGTFSLDFNVPNDAAELSVGISNSARGGYEIIAQYDVR